MVAFNIKKSQAGNVLFIILIAVALFAALSYAITNDRTTAKDSGDEEQKLDQAVVDNYMTCINQGQMTLQIARGCSSINYDPPSEWSGSNFKCHMFHPQGGGCAYQELGINECDAFGLELTDLDIGESCGDIVYAGESGGNRIYTTKTDQGTATWDNGTSANINTGANSSSDGLTNTNTLVGLADAGAPYNAAVMCRNLGGDWYLPSRDEADLLYDSKDEGELNGTFDETGVATSGWYWTSSGNGNHTASAQRFNTGILTGGNKGFTARVRCTRRD